MGDSDGYLYQRDNPFGQFCLGPIGHDLGIASRHHLFLPHQILSDHRRDRHPPRRELYHCGRLFHRESRGDTWKHICFHCLDYQYRHQLRHRLWDSHGSLYPVHPGYDFGHHGAHSQYHGPFSEYPVLLPDPFPTHQRGDRGTCGRIFHHQRCNHNCGPMGNPHINLREFDLDHICHH